LRNLHEPRRVVQPRPVPLRCKIVVRSKGR
jgi:hypothetical protein